MIEERPRKGDLTRGRIVRAAIRLFAKRGFAEVSLQEVAESCGLSQSALFHHFDDKAELIEAAVKAVVQNNHAAVRSGVRPDDGAHARLMKHFQGNLRWALDNPEEARMILLLYYFSSTRKPFAKLYGAILAAAREKIHEMVLAGRREGVFRGAVPADVLAESLHDLLLGGLVSVVALPAAPGAVRAVGRKWELLIRELCGVTAPES